MNNRGLFHRRGAKAAEIIFIMFAVERTANIKDNLPRMLYLIYVHEIKLARKHISRRAVVYHFLASHQKVKR